MVEFMNGKMVDQLTVKLLTTLQMVARVNGLEHLAAVWSLRLAVHNGNGDDYAGEDDGYDTDNVDDRLPSDLMSMLQFLVKYSSTKSTQMLKMILQLLSQDVLVSSESQLMRELKLNYNWQTELLQLLK